MGSPAISQTQHSITAPILLILNSLSPDTPHRPYYSLGGKVWCGLDSDFIFSEFNENIKYFPLTYRYMFSYKMTFDIDKGTSQSFKYENFIYC